MPLAVVPSMTRRSAHDPPPLASARVRLEAITPSQAQAFLAGTPEPGLPWAPGFPLAALRPALTMLLDAAAAGTDLGPFFAYVIVRVSDGTAVGDAGFHGPPDADGDVQVGYALVPAARGAGLATEAVGLLTAWALARPDVRSVSALVDPANLASRRLLERLGFRRAGQRDGLQRFLAPASRDRRAV